MLSDQARHRSAVRARSLISAALFLFPAAAKPAGLTIQDAIRAAWRQNPGIAASARQVAAARADADAARDQRLPSLTLSAKAIATDEPVGAFGLKMDEQKITAADFAPNRLNAPDPIGGIGLGASLMQPIYMGGRLTAGRRATEDLAQAESSSHERRTQEMALNVVQAYFGTEVASDALRYADDVLQQAIETERFVKSRNQQGLALDADVARATAFRAQAEADRAAAVQRLASARAALALLAGDEAGAAELLTPITPEAPAAGSAGAPGRMGLERPDLQAARLRASAADAGIAAARGAVLPQVVAQASVDTMRAAVDQGATWFTLALVASWKLDLADVGSTRAAEARASAAQDALRWQQLQARHEVDEARRAVASADARVASAQEAVAASESARALRLARYRQGLLPLTDVLDAEAGLAGARTLLLRSLFEARTARAQLKLALGEPIEGVKS